MNAKELINQLSELGFSIDCEDSQLVIAPGDKLTEEMKQAILENKAAILDELKQPVTLHETCTKRDVTLHPRYTVTVPDATVDPVLVQVTIAGLATFDLAIPLAKYDPFAIIDAIERYSPVAALWDNLGTPFADENEHTVELPDEPEREAA